MKAVLCVLAGIAAGLILMFALEALVGILFWVGVAVLVLLLVACAVGGFRRERSLTKPSSRIQQRRLDRDVEARLREMEKKTGQQ